MANTNYIAGYSQNDFFYANSNVCGTQTNEGMFNPGSSEATGITSDQCVTNQSLAAQLQSTRDQYASSLQKHEDILKMYNREILYMFNMIVGVGLVGYYIYLNKKIIMK